MTEEYQVQLERPRDANGQLGSFGLSILGGYGTKFPAVVCEVDPGGPADRTNLVSGLAMGDGCLRVYSSTVFVMGSPIDDVLSYMHTVYLLIYRTAKNNYFGNCLGIIGTDFYTACEVSGIIRTSKQLHAS